MKLVNFFWNMISNNKSAGMAETGHCAELRKSSLTDWVKSFRPAHAPAIVDCIAKCGGSVCAGSLPDDVLIEFIESCESQHELVAAATLSRRYGRRENRLIFQSVAEKLAGLLAPFQEKDVNFSDFSITLITAASQGMHLRLVMSYAAALAAIPSVRKVNVVFTAEWEWARWGDREREKFEKSLVAKVKAQIPDEYSYVEEKIAIKVAPDVNELLAILGDVVFRFEGVALFKTTWMFAAAIASVRPVITVTFSSLVPISPYSSLTIVRAPDVVEERSVYAEPPLLISESSISLPQLHDGSKSIVTVYAGQRIAAGLRSLSKGNWESILGLLEANEDLKWVLVGAADVDLAKREVPDWVLRSSVGERIVVLGFSDLEEIYREAVAFLCFPGMFGGSGGATNALLAGVPILAYEDSNSDISNLIEREYYVDGLDSAIARIDDWLAQPLLWEEFTVGQQKKVRSRTNLKEKGGQLLSIMKSAHEQWASN